MQISGAKFTKNVVNKTLNYCNYNHFNVKPIPGFPINSYFNN